MFHLFHSGSKALNFLLFFIFAHAKKAVVFQFLYGLAKKKITQSKLIKKLSGKGWMSAFNQEQPTEISSDL